MCGLELWEILVPTVRRVDGIPYRTRFHRVWDKKVKDISRGLTILPISKGQWISPEGEIFHERMIPVRIACTSEQIVQIIDMSMLYYDQLAIMAYRISEHVVIKHREPT